MVHDKQMDRQTQMDGKSDTDLSAPTNKKNSDFDFSLFNGKYQLKCCIFYQKNVMQAGDMHK